ncbi:MAG: hypothetical protein R3A47_02650 [Polyangiales bacterium]
MLRYVAAALSVMLGGDYGASGDDDALAAAKQNTQNAPNATTDAHATEVSR